MSMVTKVLIGEDEALVALDLEMSLSEMGYLVVGVVSSGQGMIRLNRELHPDVILMDIRLSGSVDGFQAAEQIQKEYGVPILFVSAGAETAMPQEPSSSAIYGFLR